jgi:hypothetical protein
VGRGGGEGDFCREGLRSRARPLPRGLFKSTHDIGLRERTRGGERALSQYVIHQASSMLHLNCKSGGEGEVWLCGVRHYNFGPNENEWGVVPAAYFSSILGGGEGEGGGGGE